MPRFSPAWSEARKKAFLDAREKAAGDLREFLESRGLGKLSPNHERILFKTVHPETSLRRIRLLEETLERPVQLTDLRLITRRDDLLVSEARRLVGARKTRASQREAAARKRAEKKEAEQGVRATLERMGLTKRGVTRLFGYWPRPVRLWNRIRALEERIGRPLGASELLFARIGAESRIDEVVRRLVEKDKAKLGNEGAIKKLVGLGLPEKKVRRTLKRSRLSSRTALEKAMLFVNAGLPVQLPKLMRSKEFITADVERLRRQKERREAAEKALADFVAEKEIGEPPEYLTAQRAPDEILRHLRIFYDVVGVRGLKADGHWWRFNQYSGEAFRRNINALVGRHDAAVAKENAWRELLAKHGLSTRLPYSVSKLSPAMAEPRILALSKEFEGTPLRVQDHLWALGWSLERIAQVIAPLKERALRRRSELLAKGVSPAKADAMARWKCGRLKRVLEAIDAAGIDARGHAVSVLRRLQTAEDKAAREGRKIEDLEKDASLDARNLYFEELGRHPVLSHEQMQELARKAREGDAAAKEKMILHNLRLVLPIARRYLRPKVELLDLIQEGNIGLMKGVEKWDQERGFHFSAYATWWIRHAITRALADRLAREVRLPVHLVEKMRSVAAARERYLEQGKIPTFEELRAETGLSAKGLAAILAAEESPASLEKAIGRKTLSDFVPSAEASPEEKLLVREAGENALAALESPHTAAIRAYFGIPYPGEHAEGTPERAVNEFIDKNPGGGTLEEIGLKLGSLITRRKRGRLGLTRERVRQIIEFAKQKLKEGAK
ncbi:MAG: sigma-70 family RNA polymerase sigma factor [Candidatus Micrarchaeota archaeon]